MNSFLSIIAPSPHNIMEMAQKLHIDSGNITNDSSKIKFIAIGDGGNELGMSKVSDIVRTDPNIIYGRLISAVNFEPDDLIVAIVSNWGEYRLAISSVIIRCDDIQQDRFKDCNLMEQNCSNRKQILGERDGSRLVCRQR